MKDDKDVNRGEKELILGQAHMPMPSIPPPSCLYILDPPTVHLGRAQGMPQVPHHTLDIITTHPLALDTQAQDKGFFLGDL